MAAFVVPHAVEAWALDGGYRQESGLGNGGADRVRRRLWSTNEYDLWRWPGLGSQAGISLPSASGKE
ncbi:hypothetical protein, partial [Rhodovulum sp. BSW8]|uniref:hypothetical protein n=1 Tax=Rhodovulum sp. BSW8 TaxID=2259645 RepID=UPI001A9CF395